MKNKGKSVKKIPHQLDHAKEAKELSRTLIAKYHSHLVSCEIAYLFSNKTKKKHGREVVASAKKASPELQFLAGCQFVITISYPVWQELDEKVKLAVMDHELSHCMVEDDEETGDTKYSLLPHDVEEFSGVILRHGLYTTDLYKLGNVVQEAMENLPKGIVVKKLGDTSKAKPAAEKVDEPAAKKKKLVVKRSDDEPEKKTKLVKKTKLAKEPAAEEKKSNLKVKRTEDPPSKTKPEKKKRKLEDWETDVFANDGDDDEEPTGPADVAQTKPKKHRDEEPEEAELSEDEECSNADDEVSDGDDFISDIA